MNWAMGLIVVVFLPLIALAVIAEWKSHDWIRRVDSISRGKAHQASLPNRYEK